MKIDPAGWPFVVGGVLVAVLAQWFVDPFPGFLLFLLPAFFLFFFRDPERVHDAPESAVISPADGRVIVAGPPIGTNVPAGVHQQISIFLSPVDVHVNRMPVGGRVVRVAYHPGRFLPAYRAESGDLNEHTEITVDHGGQTVVVRQIVGVLARRIVCRTSVGCDVRAGERFGVMKFGSRMDVFLPADATILTKVGETVVGGVTVIALLGSPDGEAAVAEQESVHAT